jgi:hypothetical protein
MKKTRLTIGAAALCVTALIAAPAPAAEEPTRTEYKASAEPICKANSEANEHILKGVRKKVQQGKLGVAGGQFTRAASALKKTLRQLKVLPRPQADEQRLTDWLKGVGEEATLLQQAGTALKAEQRRKAETLSARLVSGARLTNAIVVPFSFQYCRFEPSKYTS